MSAALVEVRDLTKHYPVGGGWWGPGARLRAVDGVSLDVGRGEIVGLVGESGSGKTTFGRAILRLIEPTSGRVTFDGRDVLAMPSRDLRTLRRRMQIVFQDPSTSLNPRMRVKSLVGEPLVIHRIARGEALREKTVSLLEEVGLDAAAMERFPQQFSGGQRQRIGIARALALRPDFVVLDEPVSALDVSVQAQIINLLVDLQRRHGMAYLFISHDLSVIGHLCDRIAVMYLGRLVEQGPAELLTSRPAHPYTQALFAASPPPDPGRARGVRAPIPGEMPSPVTIPPGCRFHTRCPHAVERCRAEEPALRELTPSHGVACHLAEDIPTPPRAPGSTGPHRTPAETGSKSSETEEGGA